MAIDITDENFKKEVLKQSNKIPVLVDFWAPWCGPCMMLKPVLEKLSIEFEGKMILAKVNVDENKKYATDYGVMSIPSVKLFKDEKFVNEFNGAQPEDTIKSWLIENL